MYNSFCRLLSLTIVVLYLSAPPASALQSDPPSIPGFDTKAIEEMSKKAAEAYSKAIQEAMKKGIQVPSGEGAEVAELPNWLKSEHWEMMSTGMPESAVKEILGPPARITPVGPIQTWWYGIVNDKRELAASEMVGQVAIENGKVVEFHMIPQQLTAAQAKWKKTHPAYGGEEQTGDATPAEAVPVTPVSAGEGLPNYLAFENWSLVKGGLTGGMNRDQVRAILGEPSRETSGSMGSTWEYLSLQSGGQHVLGSIQFMGSESKALNVFPPRDPELLKKEREYWVEYVLAGDASGVTLDGCPGWLSLRAWMKIKNGMTKAEVEEILGKPTRPIDKTSAFTFYYDAWAPYKQAGSVRLGGQPGAIDKVAEVNMPDGELLTNMTNLIKLQRSSPGDWPRWTDPAAWANLTIKAEPDGVLALLGEPERKARETDQRSSDQRMVERWYYGESWSTGSNVKCNVVFSDPRDGHQEMVGAQAPDWSALTDAVQKRGGGLAQAPRWSNPDAWLRLNDYLKCTASVEVDNPSVYISAGNKVPLLGEVKVTWKESGPALPGFWRAVLAYEHGGSIGYTTFVLKSQPQPESPYVRGFVDEIVPPSVSQPKKKSLINKGGGIEKNIETNRVHRMAAWKTMECQFDKSAGLRMNSYVNMREIERIIGAPDRIERTTEKRLYEFGIESDRNGNPDPDPVPKYVDGPVCIFHYGDGAIAIMLDHQRAGEAQSAQPQGGKIVRLSPPSRESMFAATGGHPWPSFSSPPEQTDAQRRPSYLDASRWKHIEENDSLLWVIRVLGQPQEVDTEPKGTTSLIYKSWTSEDKTERWYAGRVEFANNVRVTKIVPPRKKED